MTLFEEKYREIVDSTEWVFSWNQSRICAAKFTKVQLVCCSFNSEIKGIPVWIQFYFLEERYYTK